MRRRDTPLPEPPDRHPFVRVTVVGWDDPLVLRCPSLGRLQRLSRSWDLAIQADDLEALENAGGGFLAACWADPRWELEADKRDSAACWDELHDAGFTIAAVSAIVGGLSSRAIGQAPTEQEVADLVNFTG